MIKKLKIAISIAILVLVFVIFGTITKLVKANEQVNVSIEYFNDNEFQVVIDAEEGQEFTAYGIEVVGGKAVVSLMEEETE